MEKPNIISVAMSKPYNAVDIVIIDAWIGKKLEERCKSVKQMCVPDELNVLLTCGGGRGEFNGVLKKN